MLMYLITCALNLVRDLRGLIANESAKRLARSPFIMECNSMVRSRSYICIVTILNQSKYSLSSSCCPCLMAFTEFKVFGLRRTYSQRLVIVRQSYGSFLQVEMRTIGLPFLRKLKMFYRGKDHSLY